MLAAVATGSPDMPSNEPAPEVGTAEQAAPKGLSPMASVIDSEGLADGAAEVAVSEEEEPEPESDEPHAARVRGRARARAATVRRVERMGTAP